MISSGGDWERSPKCHFPLGTVEDVVPKVELESGTLNEDALEEEWNEEEEEEEPSGTLKNPEQIFEVAAMVVEVSEGDGTSKVARGERASK